MPTESSQWRKFLQPVVTGLVALMAAGVGYLQYLQRGESVTINNGYQVVTLVNKSVQYTADRLLTGSEYIRITSIQCF